MLVRRASALLVIAFCLFAGVNLAEAQSTAFVYQGMLSVAGSPANGIYDVCCGIFSTNYSGSSICNPVTNTGVLVSNGIFMVTLDYGNVFDGDLFWMEIGVRTNGSANAFTTLTPRQIVTR